jgi:hypothetical protein
MQLPYINGNSKTRSLLYELNFETRSLKQSGSCFKISLQLGYWICFDLRRYRT